MQKARGAVQETDSPIAPSGLGRDDSPKIRGNSSIKQLKFCCPGSVLSGTPRISYLEGTLISDKGRAGASNHSAQLINVFVKAGLGGKSPTWRSPQPHWCPGARVCWPKRTDGYIFRNFVSWWSNGHH